MNEYGSAGNTPHNDLGKALDAEAPAVAKYIGEAVDRLWR
jgi:hypothetical protein